MTTPYSGRPDARHREPLWDRVDRNRFVLVAYVTLFWLLGSVGATLMLALPLVLLSALGSGSWVFAGNLLAAAPVIAAVGTGLYVVNAVLTSERRLLKRLGAHIVAKGELVESKMAVKDMAIAAGMACAPSFNLIENSNVNAFIVAVPGRRPALGVTRGLIERLTIEEQRAVYANLVARFRSGDTVAASAITALLWPVQVWRDRRNAALTRSLDHELINAGEDATTGDPLVVLFFFGFALVLLAELLAASHRRAQLRAAEKADAEAMLLLKDPLAMLAALEHCIRVDNVVPSAGEVYGELFYIWTGDSTDDEDDPQWERVARLREVLGVEGFVPDEEPRVVEPFYPAAPRLEQR